jgi:arsenate reductase
MRQRVLFLCTHNSARSQMAEGFVRALAGNRFDVASAGTEATRVHPLAIRVMSEVGIDLSGHNSKALDRFLGERWDSVITVCDRANEACPVFPAKTTRLHWSVDDPSAASGSEEGRVKVFRSRPSRRADRPVVRRLRGTETLVRDRPRRQDADSLPERLLQRLQNRLDHGGQRSRGG